MTAPYVGEVAKAFQRDCLLQALKAGPVSTVEAREVYGIASPAPRVLELPRLGYDISTGRATVPDAQGRPHTVARYRLSLTPSSTGAP